MRHLSIDIETKSGADISKAGAYKYAQDPEFQVLLFAFKWDDEDVQIVDFTAGESLPPEVTVGLSDPEIIKHAYNAAFEWWCLNQAGFYTPLDQWRCTMVHALYCGYPAGLALTGVAAGLPKDAQKLRTGNALIKYFCTPATPTKSNGGRPWNLPKHAPEKWELFKEYCKQDVVAENEILKRLNGWPVPEEEEELWQQDVLMNAYGVKVDMDLVNGALTIDATLRDQLLTHAKSLTGLDNPNSTAQMLEWVNSQFGPDQQIDNLRKATVAELMEKDLPDQVYKALDIRKQLAKTSIKKYAAIDAAVGEDRRVRGISQFYGANRTGRYAGRLVQMQNLPRNHISDLRDARVLVKLGRVDSLQIMTGDVSGTLSQLIRTAFIPSEGRHFVVADFSAIEARVIAWLAGEHWVNEVFATHGKIYEATAARMFNVPVEKITKGNPEYELRQKGKVATLALGYQGGVPALKQMGALDMGIPEEELPGIVDMWRTANSNITQMWHDIEEAAKRCIRTGVDTRPEGCGAPYKTIVFRMEGEAEYGQSFLTIELPGGRKLFYPKAHIGTNRFDKPAICYYGLDSHQWCLIETYGGKLTENIVQAIARDLLCKALQRISTLGFDIVFHVHDEVIIDAPMWLKAEQICEVMSQPVDWAKGLVLKAAGFESDFYMKD
ncbi:MAG: DNA polymerase [Firmicutes bacterium]|nr:DNA polymerase [Bacillota bacterium]